MPGFTARALQLGFKLLNARLELVNKISQAVHCVILDWSHWDAEKVVVPARDERKKMLKQVLGPNERKFVLEERNNKWRSQAEDGRLESLGGELWCQVF